MKTSFIKLLLAGASALAALGFATPALAFTVAGPTAPYAVYSFSGNCFDCSQVGNPNNTLVTGSLTLQSFVPGGSVSDANFYSLSYGGSNLFQAFTVFGSEVIGAGGFFLSSGGFPGSAVDTPLDFYVTFMLFSESLGTDRQVFFESSANGNFRLGEGTGLIADNDFGGSAGWTLTQTVSANDVPEPGSLLLMGAALVAFGVVRRRRV